mmetsp:Transcript_39617/g.55019  ORF Transcript_39617/g.55019 Transcript_39617/m.55019 type:complete len:136 (+) Transcript_39617:88-495(+)|eukprot:CAMPEP_0196581652 /NCGR_PEP_ID=MMETSP1081-20130531/34828_1 /TAXON_ID=36882 /ORGANISM="Pyramimonas amylifera, Strain CCMP720" /LENGTH=135 /DNA_ID=CAMNT_0041901967 /DNA_START=72 /DNA_END=479 /DNA_ORIENTATION=-
MTVAVVEQQAGLLTNAEVYAVLEQRGANPNVPPCPPRTRDPAPCEVAVWEALRATPAARQTRQDIKEFFTDLQPLGLTKAEKMMLLNDPPTTPVHAHVVIEDCEERLSGEGLADKILEAVEKHFGEVLNTEEDVG